jgi:hypothetical protein
VLGSGLIMDRHGGLYASDLEHGIVVSISRTPIHTLTMKVFVRDPSKLSWEVAFKNNLPRSTATIAIPQKLSCVPHFFRLRVDPNERIHAQSDADTEGHRPRSRRESGDR